MQPRERTLVQELRRALADGAPRTLAELSVSISASEKEVSMALDKLMRSLARSPERLQVEPSRCLACGFAFEGRQRTARPGRCPRCRATRISRPRFSLVS